MDRACEETMSYSGIGTLYAAAGLGQGPTGISPPFRRYGFRSFDGLGGLGAIDRLMENKTRTFVFSITSVHGLTPGANLAPLVPRRIAEYLTSNGLGSTTSSGWAAGGRVWGRFTLPAGSQGITDSASRRGKVLRSLEQAARSIAPTVYFEVAGYGRVPQDVPQTSATTPQVTITTPSEVGAEASSTVNVMELQNVVYSKGFNPGTIDGKWGRNTSGALAQAAAAAGAALASGAAVGSADGRSVSLPSAVWSAIAALPARAAPSTPAAPRPAISVTDIAPEVEEGAGFPMWLPWTLGAVALVGVGGFFIWRGRKRRPRPNRRRRRRRSSRRSSRRR